MKRPSLPEGLGDFMNNPVLETTKVTNRFDGLSYYCRITLAYSCVISLDDFTVTVPFCGLPLILSNFQSTFVSVRHQACR